MSRLPGILRVTSTSSLGRARSFGLRSGVRFNTTPSYQPPQPPPHGDNAHRAFYKSWGIPVTKVFLGALFTYQLIYWSWLKLESVENQQVNDGEIKRLEVELAKLTGNKPANG